MNKEWLTAVHHVLKDGQVIAPRGRQTKEVIHHTTVVDMNRPVLTVPGRRLGYRFMAAEAFWILSGDDRVATIEPWSKDIVNYSDDGKTFAGAYGPRFLDQLDYVVETLAKDLNTRQAVMTFWKPNPRPSKDIPCTVGLDFKVRDGSLHCSVFMRSSDVWLGLPYDVFSFSMIAVAVCACLNTYLVNDKIKPGRLFLTAASSHLYEDNWASALNCMVAEDGMIQPEQPPVPEAFYLSRNSAYELTMSLEKLRHKEPGLLRWWVAE